MVYQQNFLKPGGSLSHFNPGGSRSLSIDEMYLFFLET